MRIPVHAFVPNRSQQRSFNKHSHLQTQAIPPGFHSDHYQLYLRYQASRHPGGGMDHDSIEQYTQFLLQSRVDTRLVVFSQDSDQHPQPLVKMISVVDVVNDGLSAVYTFYEPDHNASYGTYSVLWMIEQARILNLPYVYLGYWIAQSSKMAYKEKFKPHELLIEGTWSRHG